MTTMKEIRDFFTEKFVGKQIYYVLGGRIYTSLVKGIRGSLLCVSSEEGDLFSLESSVEFFFSKEELFEYLKNEIIDTTFKE